jgi:hypothetical protein
MTAQLLHAFVDENGDRGTSHSSSRFFSLAAVVVADESLKAMNDALLAARAKLSVPTGKPFHWVSHAKTFDRRQCVTSFLSCLDVTVLYVVMEKASLPDSSVMRTDRAKFYNYTAGLMMERVLLAADGWPEGPRDVHVKFGHVRGHDHLTTVEYFGRKQVSAPGYIKIPWVRLGSPPKFLDAGASLGLQAADAYAGMLSLALYPNSYGGYQSHHLLEIRHQLRRDPAGRSASWGFKTMTLPATMQTFPWWPVGGL